MKDDRHGVSESRRRRFDARAVFLRIGRERARGVSLAVTLSVGAALSCLAPLAAAHEFWIEALDFRIDVDEPLLADLRNGEEFTGVSFPYLPDRFVRFGIDDGTGEREVSGRLGDFPALEERPEREGLHTLVYESSGTSLVYDGYEEFESFVREEGMEWVLEAHDARGLSRERIGELFRRFAKALVAVGDAGGADRAVGLELELIARSNPYVIDDGALEVELRYRGEPLERAQVSVFHRDPASTVGIDRQRTDGKGRVTLDVSSPGTYLVNAVHMHEPSPEDQASSGAAWESLWASLTFARD